jgi:hypothetical protein
MFQIRQNLIDSLSTFLNVKCLCTHALKDEEEYIIGKVIKAASLLSVAVLRCSIQSALFFCSLSPGVVAPP